jgi:hypothetical protein
MPRCLWFGFFVKKMYGNYCANAEGSDLYVVVFVANLANERCRGVWIMRK